MPMPWGRSWFDRLTTNGRGAHHEREGRSPRTAGALTTNGVEYTTNGRETHNQTGAAITNGAERTYSVRPEPVEGRSTLLESGPFMVRQAHHERQGRPPTKGAEYTTNGRGAHQRRAPSIPRTAGAPANEGRRVYHERQGRPPTKGAEYTTNGRGAHHERGAADLLRSP